MANKQYLLLSHDRDQSACAWSEHGNAATTSKLVIGVSCYDQASTSRVPKRSYMNAGEIDYEAEVTRLDGNRQATM